MARTLNLEIISPEGVIYKDNVSQLVVNTATGQITVLPSHTPLFTKLSEGEALIKKDNDLLSIAISGGFLEVVNNSVNILADFAIRSEEIELEEISQAKRKAEDILKQKKEGEEFETAKAELRKTLLELKIADKYRKKKKSV